MNFSQTHIHLALKTVLFGSVALSLPAVAEEVMPTVTLDEIIINASSSNPTAYTIRESSASTGLDLSLAETPQLVTTVTAQRIKDQDNQSLVDVMKDTNGIHVRNIDGGRTSFYSRGFGISKIHVDGMPLDFNGQLLIGENHVSSVIYDTVEVTHGATGLVSGSGEPSARVNVVRKRAENATPASEITLSADEFGHYGVVFDHARGLNTDGSVRGRVIVAHSDGDTYVDGEEKGESRLYGVIDADIGEKTKAGIGMTVSELRQHGTMWGGLPAYYSDGSRTDWDVNKTTSTDWSIWDNKTYEVFSNVSHQFTPNWQAELKTNYRVVNGEAKLLWLYGDTLDKNTGLGLGINPYRSKNDYKQFNIQGDVKGYFDLFGKTHQAMFGASHTKFTQKADTFLDWTKAQFPPHDNFFAWDGSYPEYNWDSATQSVNTTMKENSAYLATQLKPTEKLSVILGSRLSEYKRTGTQWGTVNQKAEDAWTPYAGVTYAFSPQISAYASYTSIFRPQSVRDVNGNHLDAEMGDTYELGFKSSVLDDKLQTQFGLFYTQKDNAPQRLSGTFVKGTENSTKEIAYTTTNGATSQGFEIELSGKFSKNLMGTLGYSYTDAKTATGNPLDTTIPSQMIKAFATYDMNDYVNGLTVGAGVNYTSERYAILTHSVTKKQEKYSQDGFTVVDLMARYQVNNNLEAQLNLHNLFDKQYITNNWRSNQLNFGEPRTLSGSLTYRF
ncbi:TonB-dependent siderophore receptor [Moraxella boevrei]|uniref:TonB-dependent siderophore receptor n=1 Tax=Faucicola boevrei TaxID=346665 RepID=UPI0037351110